MFITLSPPREELRNSARIAPKRPETGLSCWISDPKMARFIKWSQRLGEFPGRHELFLFERCQSGGSIGFPASVGMNGACPYAATGGSRSRAWTFRSGCRHGTTQRGCARGRTRSTFAVINLHDRRRKRDERELFSDRPPGIASCLVSRRERS